MGIFSANLTILFSQKLDKNWWRYYIIGTFKVLQLDLNSTFNSTPTQPQLNLNLTRVGVRVGVQCLNAFFIHDISTSTHTSTLPAASGLAQPHVHVYPRLTTSNNPNPNLNHDTRQRKRHRRHWQHQMASPHATMTSAATTAATGTPSRDADSSRVCLFFLNFLTRLTIIITDRLMQMECASQQSTPPQYQGRRAIVALAIPIIAPCNSHHCTTLQQKQLRRRPPRSKREDFYLY